MPGTGAAASSEFRLFEIAESAKALGKLSARAFLRRKLDSYVNPQLRGGPFHGPNIRKLQGYHLATWRYRNGAYRVFYSVDERARIVFLLTEDDRKDTYR